MKTHMLPLNKPLFDNVKFVENKEEYRECSEGGLNGKKTPAV